MKIILVKLKLLYMIYPAGCVLVGLLLVGWLLISKPYYDLYRTKVVDSSVERKIQSMLSKPDANIFIIDTTNSNIKNILQNHQFQVYEVLPEKSLETLTVDILRNVYCTGKAPSTIYFLWTSEHGKDIYQVGSAARVLYLFFDITNLGTEYHVYSLKPRQPIIQKFCDLQTIADQTVLIIMRDDNPDVRKQRKWNYTLPSGNLHWSVNQDALPLSEELLRMKAKNGIVYVDTSMTGKPLEYPMIQISPIVAFYNTGWYDYERKRKGIWYPETIAEEPIWVSTPENGLWARTPATIVLYSPRDQKVSLHMRLRYLYSKDPGLMKIQINEKIVLTNKVSTKKTFKADIDLQEGWNTITLRLGAGNYRPIVYSPLSLDFRLLSFSVKEIDIISSER